MIIVLKYITYYLSFIHTPEHYYEALVKLIIFMNTYI